MISIKSKKIISILCAAILLFSGIAVNAYGLESAQDESDSAWIDATVSPGGAYEILYGGDSEKCEVFSDAGMPNDGDDTELFETLEKQLTEGLRERKSVISFSGISISFELFQTYYPAVLELHPDIFYTGLTYRCALDGNRNVVAIQPSYTDVTEEQIEEFYTATAQFLSETLEPGMSDVQKVLAIHDRLVNDCQYDTAAVGNPQTHIEAHRAYGALVEGLAVCEGYTLLMNWLLSNCCDISCFMVNSEAMNHCWNFIEIDEKWYHLDVTWDDSSVFMKNSAGELVEINSAGAVSHKYFLRGEKSGAFSDHTGYASCGESLDCPNLSQVQNNTMGYYYRDGRFATISSDYGIVYTQGKDGDMEKVSRITGSAPRCLAAVDSWLFYLIDRKLMCFDRNTKEVSQIGTCKNNYLAHGISADNGILSVYYWDGSREVCEQIDVSSYIPQYTVGSFVSMDDYTIVDEICREDISDFGLSFCQNWNTVSTPSGSDDGATAIACLSVSNRNGKYLDFIQLSAVSGSEVVSLKDLVLPENAGNINIYVVDDEYTPLARNLQKTLS